MGGMLFGGWSQHDHTWSSAPGAGKWFTNLAKKKKHQEVSSVWSWPSFFLQISLWFTHWAIGFPYLIDVKSLGVFVRLQSWRGGSSPTWKPALEGAPTIWIGVGLGHFPSPRGCSDDAWASSCFFFKGGEESVVPRTGNEKCLKTWGVGTDRICCDWGSVWWA